MRMARLASASVARMSVATSGSSDLPFSRISLATSVAYFERGRCAVSGAIMQVVDFARRANLSRVGAIDFGRKSPAKSVHPGPHKGAFRDRHGRRVGMRWTRAALLPRGLIRGRWSRGDSPRGRCGQVRDDASHHTGDGGKQARSPGRARNKLLKPSRAGMPGDPGATVVTNACVLLPYTRGCGCNGHPAFPTPSLGRIVQAQLGRDLRRGNAFGCEAAGYSKIESGIRTGERCVPRMLRSAPLLRRGALLIRGPCARRYYGSRLCGASSRDAAPRPGAVLALPAMTV